MLRCLKADFEEIDFFRVETLIKVSKSCHNLRTKLRIKLLNDQKRDNTESYLRCKFQYSPFSVLCKVT